jgi:hypothetical protein
MTVNTLSAYPIINLAISDVESDVTERDNLLEDFLLSNVKEMETLPESFTINDLTKYCFGNQYTGNYFLVRKFIQNTQKQLRFSNKDVLSTGLALIFNEGVLVKEDCKKIHPSYRSGGAYLFSRKFLFMLLLTKSIDFRMFLRSLVDDEGKQVYEVPHNLKEKNYRITDSMVAA